VALVFIRSADWCLFCQLLTVQIQKHRKEIEASGGQVVVLSYDAAPLLKRFADNQNITLPLLSDPGSKIIDAYDMRSPAGSGNQVGCSRHGTFIIDQKGIVRAKPYPVSYQERPVVDTLVKALKEAQNMNGGTKL
jgi:peroxiredoxin